MYKTVLGAVLSLGIALNASALTIQNPDGVYDGVEVGTVDQFLSQTGNKLGSGKLANSNPTTEAAWVSSVLGVDSDFSVKTENVKYFQTDADNVFAFELASAPEYYLIKNSQYWALFSNSDSLDWAAFDASELFQGFNLPDLQSLTISHVTEFGAGVTPVPLPASLPLLLAALASLGWFRMKGARK